MEEAAAHLDVGDLTKELEGCHEGVFIDSRRQVAHVQSGHWLRRLATHAVAHQQAILSQAQLPQHRVRRASNLPVCCKRYTP
jgi:hypothetical protein